MRVISAFSLIELMIVIAIISTLAVGAGYIYRDYLIRSKVSKALIIVNAFRDRLIESYERNGVWPSSIAFNGATFTAGVPNWVNTGGVVMTRYFVNSNGIWMDSTISGLEGMTGGYIAPTTLAAPTNSYQTLRTVVVDDDGIWRKYCGIWYAGVNTDIHMQYLPKACQCASLQTIFSTGNTSLCTGL